MNEEIFKKVTDVIVAKLEVKAEDVKPESDLNSVMTSVLTPWTVLNS